LARSTRSRKLGINLDCELTRIVDSIEAVDVCGEESNLGAERLTCLLVKWCEEVCLGRSEAVVEGVEELCALLGDDDLPSPPIGRIRPAFDQVCRFEVVEEVGHDGAVDTQMLGQGELAPHDAPGGSGQNLIATGTAREAGDRGERSRHVGPKDRAEAPSEVICQCVVTPARLVGSLSLTRDVGHACSIRGLQPEKISKPIF
jgi:hypothetical protein